MLSPRGLELVPGPHSSILLYGCVDEESGYNCSHIRMKKSVSEVIYHAVLFQVSEIQAVCRFRILGMTVEVLL